MKKKLIISKLNSELNAVPVPEVLEAVRKKSQIIPLELKQESKKVKQKSKFVFRFASVATAFILLALILVSSLSPILFSTNYTTITVDINPSMELTIDENETVTMVNAINNDAINLVENLNLVGASFEDVVTALLIRAREQGYIQNATQNAIMFSVTNKKDNLKQYYKNKLQTQVNAYLSNNSLNCDVIFEEYDEQLKEEFNSIKQGFTEEVNISAAKYRYIKRIMNRFPSLEGHEEALAKMNVEELYQLLNGIAGAPTIQDIINNIINGMGAGNAPGSNGN